MDPLRKANDWLEDAARTLSDWVQDKVERCAYLISYVLTNYGCFLTILAVILTTAACIAASIAPKG